MDLNRLKAERAIERIIRCIANDQQSILLFAYHLRKNEKASKFTFQILNGHLQPAILLDIILANNWDEQAKSMQVDLTKPFILVDKQYRQLTYSLYSANEIAYLRTFDEVKIQQETQDGKYSNDLYFRLSPNGGLEILKYD